jgi:CAAX prenyl protease-like protein
VTTLPVANSAYYRYLPFVFFIGFIGLEEFIRLLAGLGLIKIASTAMYFIYPVKALAIGCLLYKFRYHYSELAFRDISNLAKSLVSVAVGLLVFALWIKMDWTLGAVGLSQGFNPTLLPGRPTQLAMTFFRTAGAVLVVPLMEELFWRSFLIRYIIDKNIDSVRLGTFTWPSFLVISVLFGLEHHYILAGIMAGIFYNLILYKTRSLAQCVLAHTVTNLALAIYVVTTGKWLFW